MVKISFHKSDDMRHTVGYCVVTLHGRVVARFRIGNGDDFAFMTFVDNATARAIDAATETANDNGLEFEIYDIDYTGLRAIEAARLAAA